jgi:polar amino acid transport system substrate-binding protein
MSKGTHRLARLSDAAPFRFLRHAAVVQLIGLLLFPVVTTAQGETKVLRCGWYPWDPYQYIAVRHEIGQLTGLDVQMVRAAFSRIGYEVSYEEVGWKQHQLDIKNGARDIAAGAFKNPERAEYAYYSVPYRKETDVVYVRKGESSRYRYGSVTELLAQFRAQNIRVGIISGFYYGPDVEQFINDPAKCIPHRARRQRHR